MSGFYLFLFAHGNFCFILFAEGGLFFLFLVDVWFVLTFVLVHVNAWGVGPSGSPHFVLLGHAKNCVDICV